MALSGLTKQEKDLPMSSEFSIEVENLAKVYELYKRPIDRAKKFVISKFKKESSGGENKYYREFWAIKNISFKVRRGETVGIIGQNGAGKSTLLQIICGTLSATSGKVVTHGNIGALLELGSGFDHDFTGRENVYLNGAILGLSKKDIDNKFNDIEVFADIGNFIDQPVKTYSSGMLVRLAFAVQAQLEPEILIVDEALAVGDAKFQAKCFDRIKKLKEKGTSILLVSHSGEQIITHCDRAIFLQSGEVAYDGLPKTAINIYMDSLFGKSPEKDQPPQDLKVEKKQLVFDVDVFHTKPGYNKNEYRWGDQNAKWTDYEYYSNSIKYPHTIYPDEKVVFRLSATISKKIKNPIVGFAIKTKEGLTVYNTNSELLKCELCNQTDDDILLSSELTFINHLGPGDYFISIGIASRSDGEVTPHDRRYDVIHFLVPKVDNFSGLFDLKVEMKNNLILESQNDQ